MPFRSRNPYYLRISEKNVLPVYLYLDERHLDWMSDLILQHVLSDLRPHILPKLKAETDTHSGSTKKATVDTYRGESYQFCYFFRKTEPHSLILKTRHFVAAPPKKRSTMPPPSIPSASKPQRSKRKAAATKEKNHHNIRKKRKTKGKGKAQAQQEELEMSSSDEQDDTQDGTLQPRRSGTITNLPEGGYRETNDDLGTEAAEEQNVDDDMAGDVLDDSTALSSTRPVPVGENETDRMEVDRQDEPTSTLEIEIEEDEKPKPMLQLRYQGFSIYGHCLCIVVEPWPPIRSVSRAPSVLAATPRLRGTSIDTTDFISTAESSARARTPLFLPDDTDRERSETAAPSQSHKSLPPVPSFRDTNFQSGDLDDSDEGGMMEFSQVLNGAGDFRAGAADDDEDMEGAGAAFFGDADEAREF